MSNASSCHRRLVVADGRHAKHLSHQGWKTLLVEAFNSGLGGGNDAAYILLMGFNQDTLIAFHRQLFDLGVSPKRCYTLLPDQLETLITVSDGLVDIVIQHMVSALTPTEIVNLANGETMVLPAPIKLAENDKPTLAFVSPLPPQATGIASYSAELLPYLAPYFHLTLVIDQPELDPTLRSNYPCMDPEAFSQQAESFDYLVYQVGNSLYHAYQFALLQKHPGVVVLHDYYLFDAVWWLNESGLKPDALTHQLYEDHGYPGLLAHEKSALHTRGAEQYPVNGLATRRAGGVIYHSAYARSLADYWQHGQQAPTFIVPHLRQLPTPFDKQAARRVLGIDDEERVIASFGGINPKKLTHLLLDAFMGKVNAPRTLLDTKAATPVRLVLVGAQHSGEYGHQLARWIKSHPEGHRVTVTGYARREAYEAWLQASDIAVQLRTQSRGETSGAMFDAMAHGVAVIANAHGSSAELPENSLWLLPDDPEEALVASLRDALCRLCSDDDAREQFGQAGQDYVANNLSPEQVAQQYRKAIIEAPLTAPRYRQETYLDQLAEHSPLITALNSLDKEQASKLTKVLSEVDITPDESSPRLLFDVSTIAWDDLKTGIERVTRRIADQLLRQPPLGWRVELIRWGGDDFYLARGFAAEQLGLMPPGPDVPVEARPGDRYVTLEWAPPLFQQAGDVMKRMRANGVRFYFTVHDLLPLSHPECFPAHIPATMKAWFASISELADGISCVSRHVAEVVEAKLDQHKLEDTHRPWVQHFHLGADFRTSIGEAALSNTEQQWLKALTLCQGPVVLMVGTIEPRKGHRQVLDALEACWDCQTDINLVIVGKEGWQVGDLIRRIKQHPRYDRQLFWAEGASDALLETLYQHSDVLIAASYGEGFGLPLIEAAHYGIAILARDIPVFREVAGEFATYFSADTPVELTNTLLDWVESWQLGHAISSKGMPCLDWQQSTEQWLNTVLSDQYSNERPFS